MSSGSERPPTAAVEGAPGAGLRAASWWGTGVFAATAVAAAVVPGPSGVLRGVAFAVAVVLFLAGCVLFFAAYARGVARSRTDEVAVTTLFFLAGSVAPGVRRSLFGALGVQVAVALVTAITRPYTSLAAGALVPMYGLGLCGLWSARHGTFPPLEPGPRPPRAGPPALDPRDDDPGSVNGS
ncbi:MAG: hypothetical protein ACR2LJ_10070 [Acidimicrobiales bacterium]